jgi:sigma-B regulation protein RsbU (phosphoserine phosphatase)
MLPGLQLEEYAVGVRPGDCLVIFSDGLPDATNNEGQLFGNNRVNAAVRRGSQLKAPAMVQHLVAEVKSWRGGSPPFDDLALLIMCAG